MTSRDPSTASDEGAMMREYRLLGTFEVSVNGVDLHLAAKPRALLAALALQPNRVVAAERLQVAVWSDRAPTGAATTLRTYVSKLRRRLGGDVIAAESGGYRLSLGSDRLDVDTFAMLTRQAEQATDPLEAIDVLTDALSLWRGRALADLADVDVFRGHARRLDEQRTIAVDQLLERRLEVGDPETVIADTAALLSDDPLREPLHALRMKALYQAGPRVTHSPRFNTRATSSTSTWGSNPRQSCSSFSKPYCVRTPHSTPPR